MLFAPIKIIVLSSSHEPQRKAYTRVKPNAKLDSVVGELSTVPALKSGFRSMSVFVLSFIIWYFSSHQL